MGLKIDYLDGQTPLDDDDIEGLKIKSITNRHELDEFEQLNIEKAIQWTFGKKWSTEQILSEKFIRDLHKKMYGEVWKWAGEFRKSEKNIGIKSYLIPVELKQLLDDTMFWIQNETYLPIEIAIRFKHRLVSIHCFNNGNGRHSRLMADLIMEKIYQQKFLSWGSKNLVKASDARVQYISAVKKADDFDIHPLITFAQS